MDIQKNQTQESFEKLYVKNAPAWSLERDQNGGYKYHATQSAFLLFEQQQIEIDLLKNELAKAQAVPYEPGSFKSSHEIIINETKSELIDGYDIAKEDEYLLESLVYRGVCIGKAQAVPEGFVLVPKELSDEVADELASDAFNNAKSLFDSEYRGYSALQREHIRLRWCKRSAKQYQSDYKTMIEAQEQSHE